MNIIKICKTSYLVLLFTGLGVAGVAGAFSVNLEGWCSTPHHCLQVEVGEVPPNYIGYGNGVTIQLLFTVPFFLLGAMIPAWIEEQLKLREKNDY